MVFDLFFGVCVVCRVQLLQPVNEHLLLVRKEVGVDIERRGDRFVADALCDVERRKACVDEQGNMRMTDVVRADPAHTAVLTALVQLEKEVVARAFKHPVIRRDVARVQINVDLIQQKLRNIHIPGTLFRLWRGYDVFAVDLCVGFGDMDLFAGSINVRRSQREQLTLTHACPVEDLKGGKCLRIFGKMADKPLVFLQRPEIELFRLAASDMSGFDARIREIVVAGGVIHERRQLEIDELLVSVAVVLTQDHGLPFADMLCRDVAHPQRAEKRQDLVGKDMLFRRKGGGLEPHLHVVKIDLVKFCKSDVIGDRRRNHRGVLLGIESWHVNLLFTATGMSRHASVPAPPQALPAGSGTDARTRSSWWKYVCGRRAPRSPQP